jgi:arabinofuranosyltransferase
VSVTSKLWRSSASPATVAAVVAALVVLAWSRRFVQDDAFISYRYASNLVEGHGLVFNPGERVEGYTNFLWTLLMAAGIRLGIPIVPWSHLLGLACYAGSLSLVFLLARRLVGSSVWGLLALCVVGTNYSFSAYATGGLETSLQAFTVLLALHFAYRAAVDSRPLELACFSSVAAAALMTRLDSVLLLVAPAIALMWRVARGPDVRRRALALLLPGGVALAAWLSWKAFYYGDLLPLTFYAKTGGALIPTVKQGLYFLFAYLADYWMLPQLLLLPFFARSLWYDWQMRWIVVGGALWCGYVLWIGGDFMEFRLMTPALPLLILAVVWVLGRRIGNRRALQAMTGAFLILALGGSWHHQRTFEDAGGIESVASLRGHLSVQRWDLVGQALQRAFHGNEGQVSIAVTAAGAIPYYSKLRTVDMLGLNDAWIARHGLRVKTQPGHERSAPFRYLQEKGVNLIIAHPLVASLTASVDPSRGVDLRTFRLFDAQLEDLPRGARLIEIPIGEDLKVVVLELVQNDLVETAIRTQGWRTTAVRPATR